MARRNYSEEFRRPAVDLYESTPGATMRGIADDLGVERGTLRHWLELYGTGKKTAADGTSTRSPLSPSRSGSGHLPGSTSLPRAADETSEQELVRLRARVAELEAAEKKVTTERKILRPAAKHSLRTELVEGALKAATSCMRSPTTPQSRSSGRQPGEPRPMGVYIEATGAPTGRHVRRTTSRTWVPTR